jgi:dTDP-4-dehydrorhamnose 3,5-epimerase-like enzyme
MQTKQTTQATVDDCHISVPRLYDDDRARRACDVFGFVPGGINMGGDLNVNWIYPGRIIAWHRHHRQTDNWFVVRGHIKVGLMDDDRNVRWVYLGENDRRLLSIPPGVWHGLMALGDQEAIMIYYITSKYDESNPDEERLSVEEAGVDWTVPIK